MKRVLRALVLVGMVAGLVACGPAKEGNTCTTVGQIVTDKDGAHLQCRTDEGETVPHWHRTGD